ncbi:MAG: DNA repair protein RecN [bacterium]
MSVTARIVLVTDNTNTATTATNIIYYIIMIEKLYIKHYLIIKEAEINFINGLNILTGETGAGKSIIVDALSLILGERADYSIIKKDQDKMVIEGHFNFKNNIIVKKIMESLLPEDEIISESVIIRRELLKKGASRNFINDNPVSISELKKFGEMIIDIHSQNEHQSLLNSETHIEVLDHYSLKEETLKKYKKNFEELKESVSKFKDLSGKKEELLKKKDFLDFELKEINNLNLQPDEDEELESELKKLENIENISQALNASLKILYEDDTCSLDTVNSAVKELKKVSEYDVSFEKIISDLENSYILVKESSDSLNSYRNNLNFDNNYIEKIRQRLSDITHLIKKTGLTAGELISKGESLEKELSFADNFDYELEKLYKEILRKKEITFLGAKEIFELRKVKSKELEKKINKLLKEVGLESSEFRVDIENNNGDHGDLLSFKTGKGTIKLTENGFNKVEFLIRTNKGNDFSPLKKTVSGGEISRIMLAVKTVLAEKDKIGILVFDEIDAGISGRIASKVGKILKKLSETHQVISITHLPQIAAMSDRHFHVSKTEINKETIAGIKNLNDEEKILEIAKLISGEEITVASTKSAIELIKA